MSDGAAQPEDIFDFITADTVEGKEFAEALREDTEYIEVRP